MSNNEKKPARPPPPTSIPSSGNDVSKGDGRSYDQFPPLPSRPNPKRDRSRDS
jgi:hypothetical protein